MVNSLVDESLDTDLHHQVDCQISDAVDQLHSALYLVTEDHDYEQDQIFFEMGLLGGAVQHCYTQQDQLGQAAVDVRHVGLE